MCGNREKALNIEEFTIIASNFSNNRQRIIREALEIKGKSNLLNSQIQSAGVLKLY